MNKVFKHISLLVITATLAQFFGKYYYFDSFKLFTFNVGYVCLIEVGLIFLFIYITDQILDFYTMKAVVLIN